MSRVRVGLCAPSRSVVISSIIPFEKLRLCLGKENLHRVKLCGEYLAAFALVVEFLMKM